MSDTNLTSNEIINSVKTVFICSLCNQKFSSDNEIKEHILSHNNNELLLHCSEVTPCEDIAVPTKKKIFKKKRIRSNRHKEEIRCKLCNKKLNSRSKPECYKCRRKSKGNKGSENHANSTSKSSLKGLNVPKNKKEFVCEHCNGKFTCKTSLVRHLRRHTGEKDYECNVCNKGFFTNSDLKGHMVIHSAERPHACFVCNLRFKHKRSLFFHIRTHTGERPFPCEICGKRFSQRCHLASHYLTHSGVKPHSCEICFMCFGHKSSLRRHQLMHTNEQPYSCTICDKKFRRKHLCDRHIESHAEGDETFCKLCNHSFSTRHGLLTHQGLVHFNETTLTCNVCADEFGTATDLRQHYVIHSNDRAYFCDICNVHFTKLWMLQKHKSNYHKIRGNSQVCDYCSRKFLNRRTFTRHKVVCAIRAANREQMLVESSNSTEIDNLTIYPYIESVGAPPPRNEDVSEPSSSKNDDSLSDYPDLSIMQPEVIMTVK